jgi:hypothetical protein
MKLQNILNFWIADGKKNPNSDASFNQKHVQTLTFNRKHFGIVNMLPMEKLFKTHATKDANNMSRLVVS